MILPQNLLRRLMAIIEREKNNLSISHTTHFEKNITGSEIGFLVQHGEERLKF